MFGMYRLYAWWMLSFIPQTVLMRRNGEVRSTRVLAENDGSILITYIDAVMFVPTQLEVPYAVTMWVSKNDPRILSEVVTNVENVIPLFSRKRVNER